MKTHSNEVFARLTVCGVLKGFFPAAFNKFRNLLSEYLCNLFTIKTTYHSNIFDK